MNDTDNNEPGPFAAKVIGPFQTSHLTVNGYLVPHVTVSTVKGGAEDGKLNVMLQNRFCVCCTQEELDRWGWFLGHAMAVAAGYTGHREHSKLANPYKEKCLEIPKL